MGGGSVPVVLPGVANVAGLGRSPGEGKGYPLQYSGLENPVDCIEGRNYSSIQATLILPGRIPSPGQLIIPAPISTVRSTAGHCPPPTCKVERTEIKQFHNNKK